MSDTKPHNLGAQFAAKFDGNCKGCTLAVYEGDLMGYVDDVAVCDGCYNEAETENWEEIRANIRTQQEVERAKDPEAYDAAQGKIRRWVDSVRQAAQDHPGKEWVPAPNGIQGFVNTTNQLHQPEQEDPMPVEAGIQALMAAGLLEGQESGGSGVCNATITSGDGNVTEVAIPVPVEPETAKAPRKRASRAKPKPEPVAPAEEVPSTDSVEDAAAAALARVRNSVAVRVDAETPEGLGQAPANAARLAELEANAKDWDPAKINAEVQVEAQPDALQAGLTAAIDAGTMDEATALSLGWDRAAFMAEREGATVKTYADPTRPGATYPALTPPALPPVVESYGPRAAEAIEDFKANYDNPAADIFIDALAAAKSLPEEDAILGALDNLAPYEGMPGGVEEAKKSILAVIDDAITNHPRSLQKTIGPSEIGTECDHCLAAKLAGWDQVRDGGPWLPTVGTAVHSWIEDVAFKRAALDAHGRPRYLMERKVAVGIIGGVEITGSTDLVDLVRGMTWDWKIVGATTLRSAKTGPSLRYKVQQMLYARGWRRLGILITHVGIAYLPRNEMSLRKAVLWTAEYDESVAVAALERADAMFRNLKVMESISVEARDQYITGLPRWRSWRENVGGIEKLVYGNAHEGTIECRDCSRLADYPEDPNVASNQLGGLL